MNNRLRPRLAAALCAAALLGSAAKPDDPKPKPENTIHVELSPLVQPQNFARPVRFFVASVVDRSGNPQPLLLMKNRGGLFVDRQPAEIVREGIVASLKAASLLVEDETQADVILRPYLFHFGLEAGSGTDYFGKVELAVTVKDARSGDSKEITAAGTSIAGLAVRKKNIEKNLQEDMHAALQDAVTNLLRGTQLRDAVNGFAESVMAPAAAAGEAPAGNATGEKVPPSPTDSVPVVSVASGAGTKPGESAVSGGISKPFEWRIETTEAKHFTRAEGVELSDAFTDYLYAEVRNELMKSKKYGQVIGEGETVNAGQIGESVVIEGVLTEYKKGNRVVDGLVGFGAGARSLKMDVRMARRGERQNVVRIEVRVRVTPRMTEQVMARFAAKDIAEGLRKSWERQKSGS
jgi:hypothetical protein